MFLTGIIFFSSGCSNGDDDASATGGTSGSGGSTSSSGGSTAGSGGSTAGSGGSAQGGAGGSAQGGTGGSVPGGSAGTGSSPLFTEAPDCPSNIQKLEGNFDGATVASDKSVGSTVFDETVYYTVQRGRSEVRLEWGTSPVQNAVQPLTAGGYLLSVWDTASPDTLYCVTAGEIGFLETDSLHEYFKYSVTSVRAGEVGTTANSQPAKCDGEELTVDLHGCVQRD